MREYLTSVIIACAVATTTAAETNLSTAGNEMVSARLDHASILPSVTNAEVVPGQNRDAIRNECIQGRRVICGRVIKVLSEGLVVDSGYTSLLQAPFNQSWLVSGGAVVKRDPKALELNEPGASCIGPVFLAHYPKKPAVKLYDYVVIQGYPVGDHTYTSVPGIQKTVRNFSAGLDTAIKMNLEAGEK
jgi:hypothetical protein